jgi:hypothetical protein
VEDDSMVYITYKKKSTAVCRSQWEPQQENWQKNKIWRPDFQK